MRASHDEFRPARPSQFWIALAWRMLPLILRSRQVVRVEIAEDDIARLKALENQRVVLTPNHPTNTDPALLSELSRRARMPFYFLACREAFDGWRGWWGWIIQRLGAYSVVRGTIDRESFRYSRELLARPKTKLVIFPEGEVYSQNDSLLPFQVGAIQLAAWGQEEACKSDPDARVLLLPIALRYRFAGDVRAALHEKLSRMEEKLNLSTPSLSTPSHDLKSNFELANLYARMRNVATTVLSSVEREYGLQDGAGKTEANGDLTPRFMAAKQAALSRAAQLLGEEKLPRGTIPEQMRVLWHRAEEELHEEEPLEELPVEEHEASNPLAVAEERRERVLRAWRDLERLANWIAVYDGYASQSLCQERVAEVIFRLEKDVMGQASHAGERIASIRVGEPMELPQELSRRELPEWTKRLEDSVRALL